MTSILIILFTHLLLLHLQKELNSSFNNLTLLGLLLSDFGPTDRTVLLPQEPERDTFMAKYMTTREALRTNEVVHTDDAGELSQVVRILSKGALPPVKGYRHSLSALSGLFGVEDVLKLLSLFWLPFILFNFLIFPDADLIYIPEQRLQILPVSLNLPSHCLVLQFRLLSFQVFLLSFFLFSEEGKSRIFNLLIIFSLSEPLPL